MERFYFVEGRHNKRHKGYNLFDDFAAIDEGTRLDQLVIRTLKAEGC
jgi:hypothetical protein